MVSKDAEFTFYLVTLKIFLSCSLVSYFRYSFNRGLMDYSGAANDNAYFSVNRQKVKNAPRKLDVGDVISCVLNLEKQYVEIYVNEYEFSHVFKAPKSSLIPSGSPYDYYYGVVFGKLNFSFYYYACEAFDQWRFTNSLNLHSLDMLQPATIG